MYKVYHILFQINFQHVTTNYFPWVHKYGLLIARVTCASVEGQIKGGAKICQRVPLLQETSSSDRKTTATNRMHSNYLDSMWEEVLLILVTF